MIDLTTYSDDELATLRVAVQAESDRRSVIRSAPLRMSQINADCLDAQGIAEGDPWHQPTDATNAYPADWSVTYNGQQWRSLIPANTAKPGDPNDPQNYRWWQNETAQPPAPQPGQPAQWDGNGHAYAVGDVVAYQAGTYKCLQAHTSQPGWTPAAVPALWLVQP